MFRFIWYLILLHSTISLQILHTWKYVDYEWPSSDIKQKAIASGEYDYTKNILNDVDKSKDGRLFVAVARDKGVPATLSTISDQMGNGGPLLKPYPNWAWNDKSSCSGIISTYRNFIKCNKLYVVDNGYIGDDKVCPPKLLIFDLSSDALIKKVSIPDQVALNKDGSGFLITPVVLIKSCNQKAIVFISDNEGHALIIWDENTNEFKRFEGEVYDPQPNAINITINGETVSMEDGVIGMALAPSPSGATKLWFHPTSSFDLTSIKVHKFFGSNNNIQYTTVSNILPSQSIAIASTKSGTLFFGLVSPPSIVCFNTHIELTKENLVTVATDNETLQFASGVKVTSEGANENLYVLTNRYQKYFAGTMNFEDVNMRILKADVNKLINGTKCQI